MADPGPAPAPADAARAPLAPWPVFAEDEVAAATRVLRSGRVNYWTGDEGRAFEAEFAKVCGARRAVAVANGTVALELALRALGIGPADEVVVPARTFVATASSVALLDAVPVFADVDADSQNLTARTVEPVLTPRTRGLIPVHLAGWPCDMDALNDLARARGLKVIEDCAQAHGATHNGRPVGALGDAGAFSFCQDKILTTGGEGGMLVTDDARLWERAWGFKDHGKDPRLVARRDHPPGFRWLHADLGTNGRMTEMQAAIGRVQLTKLPEWVGRRRAHAARLSACFQGLPALRVTDPPASAGHAYYKYYAFVRPEALKAGWSRDRVMDAVQAEGVPCFAGICPEVYLEAAFRTRGLGPPKPLPVARDLGETSLMFHVHPTLTDTDLARTCDAVRKVLEEATR